VAVITVSSGRQFPADEGETLLDAALRADIALEYSCRTGRCSSCKAQVRSGSTTALHDETGLSEAERAAGWILSCVRSAASDVVLEVQDLGGVRLHPARTWPCRIQSLERLAPDVMKVVLRLPPTSALNFHPGQYVDLIGPDGLRRSYSVANAPAADKHIELHIREVPGGALSAYWFGRAQANDLLRLHGPLGTFFVRGTAGLHLVFLATGTGIAPVKAMLEGLQALSAAEHPASVTVYWGGRTEQDLYWCPEGAAATACRFVPVLSRAGTGWHGTRGHVQQALLADAPDLQRTLVYACGSDAMIHGAREALLAAGLPPERFHSDAFVCSAPA
jgi:CDP-4-dehydro-6-deoxyglucose reductase